ncbi:PREDICTED: multidrug resistance-associated protein 4-like [Branchiostoma belcheri]|uniref:Multidrug resistance-associated protein 4-like n=1 Tax=Branchiostoma belcheri TaxID=7741 RepID=A0A6P4XJG5_BRABE|nr:PREDICTED: multidrug resistance-associated protein 4-like [Branchiostoma belcheri]
MVKNSQEDIRTGLQQSFGVDIFSSDKNPLPDDKVPLHPQKEPHKSRPKQDGGRGRRNPHETANWFSKLLFCWANAIVVKGYRQRLENEDLYPLREKDTSLVVTNEFRPYWERELKKSTPEKPPSLSKAIIRCYGLRYFLVGFVKLFDDALTLVKPIIIGYIIKYFEPSSGMTLTDAYMYAGILAGLQVFQVIIGYYEWPVHLWAFHFETAIMNMANEKCLRLSTGGLSKTSTGQVSNILADDVQAFKKAFDKLHNLWVSPLTIVVITWYLINFMGLSALAGLAYMFLTIAIEGSMTPLHIKYGTLENFRKDARLDVMSQILQSMRMIKLQAWEKPFSDVINKLRRVELRIMVKGDIAKGVIKLFNWLGMDPTIFIIIITYVLMGNVLTAEKAFVTKMFLELLEKPMHGFPVALESLAEVKIAVTRLQTFLALNEYQPPNPVMDASSKDVCKMSLSSTEVVGPKGVTKTTLTNIKFDVKEGELIVVIGPTGAGKSALLCTIMRELLRVEGRVDVRGTLAFTAQEPWAYPDTIRNNIVDFGKPFDQDKYDRAISISELEKDIQGMPYGDKTFVGDRGVTLSGGQKARLGLARAVYADADIYLLDDPLSAVDAAVGKKLFDKCILGALGSKVRILVTHQLQFLNKADKILVLDKGNQVAFGSHVEVVASGADFAELLAGEGDHSGTTEDKKGLTESFYGSRTSVAEDTLSEEEYTDFVEEERVEGSVSWRVYVKYLTSGPPRWYLFMMVFVIIAFEVSYLFEHWWVAHWVDSIAHLNKTLPSGQPRPVPGAISLYHLKVYAGLESLTVLLSIMSTVLIIYATYRASVNLHNMMFNAVMRAPIGFFDKNPGGRVLNRFADDLHKVEENIPEELLFSTEGLLAAIGAVVMICIGNPLAIPPTCLLVLGFASMYTYYMPTVRHLARLKATNASPIYTHVSAVMEGLWTIRALSAQENFKRRFRDIVDQHSEAEFLDIATKAWYKVRVKVLDATFNTFITFMCIFSSESLGAGSVGLSLAYALLMSEHAEYIVEAIKELESAMINAERVIEYAELTPEAPWETDHKPPPDWPAYGAIDLKGVYLSYGEQEPSVLKNVNLNIVGGEKVGIVGRTGAGKSSLLMMLMRLVEPTGSIRIDGVDIRKLGLHDLRKKISVIQQDPIMIQGTVRKNLDPLDMHSDNALWTSLDEVYMTEDIQKLPKGLDTPIGERGGSLSVGQKQLLCLARTILYYNRILLFDEATANIDLRTDRLIQTTIRERFKHCTVLTIAHRLHTVMDSDRILVMDEGRVAEFDEPHLLLTEYPDSIFSKLVSETGESMERELRKAAHQSYLQKQEQKKSQ